MDNYTGNNVTKEDNGDVTANFEATAIDSMSAAPVRVLYMNVGSHNLLTIRYMAGERKGESTSFIVDDGDLYQVPDDTAKVMIAAALGVEAGE